MALALTRLWALLAQVEQTHPMKQDLLRIAYGKHSSDAHLEHFFDMLSEAGFGEEVDDQTMIAWCQQAEVEEYVVLNLSNGSAEKVTAGAVVATGGELRMVNLCIVPLLPSPEWVWWRTGNYLAADYGSRLLLL